MNDIQKKIIAEVSEERDRQDCKWGEQNHPLSIWANIIGEECGEVCKAVNEYGFVPNAERMRQVYTESIQASACCVALCEYIRRTYGDAISSDGRKPKNVADEASEDLWIYSDVKHGVWPDPDCASREEAIQLGRDEYDYDFYIGKAEYYVPFVDASTFIERQQESALDDVGEVAEGWLDYAWDSEEINDLQLRLQEAFDGWLAATGNNPSFFVVSDVEMIEHR